MSDPPERLTANQFVLAVFLPDGLNRSSKDAFRAWGHIDRQLETAYFFLRAVRFTFGTQSIRDRFSCQDCFTTVEYMPERLVIGQSLYNTCLVGIFPIYNK